MHVIFFHSTGDIIIHPLTLKLSVPFQSHKDPQPEKDEYFKKKKKTTTSFSKLSLHQKKKKKE